MKEESESKDDENVDQDKEEEQKSTVVGLTARGARAAAKRNRGKIGS